MPPVTRSRKESLPDTEKMSVDDDVIIISSDDENRSQRRKTRTSPRRVATKGLGLSKSTPKRILTDANSSIRSGMTDASQGLQNDKDQISARLINELIKVKQENRELLKQNKKLRKETMVFHVVHDSLACEICEGFLWDPYILMPCGHTTCRDCVVKWFKTIITRDHAETCQLRCPKCRQVVSQRPMQNYSLKSLVHVMAPIIDSTAKPPRGKPSDAVWAPFDRYFG